MGFLSGHVGSWTGTNSFRLMPTDPLDVAPAAADVSTAAAGDLTSIAYTWSHPADGGQDGLLVIGPGAEPDGAVAFWGDSWHQHPQPVVLAGEAADGVLAVTYDYGGGWRWRISVDASHADSLLVRMENVVPESEATDTVDAGPYTAMLTELRRRG